MRRNKLILTICAILLLAGAYTPRPSSALTTTPRELRANSNGVAQHVQVSGYPASGNVLIAVHGGPGITSDYMLNLWGDDDPARPVASPAILAALPKAYDG